MKDVNLSQFIPKFVLACVVAVALGACTNSSFKSDSPSGAPKTVGTQTAAPGASGTGAPGTTSGVANSAKPEVVSSDLCSQQGGLKRVFILDLKSGWFAGDGGSTFKNFTESKCLAQIEITYAHATESLIEGNFTSANQGKMLFSCLDNEDNDAGESRWFLSNADSCQLRDLSRFDSVWVLSGSEKDRADLRLNSPFFASISARLKELSAAKPNSSFFFGAGLGYTHHANALSQALFASSLGGDLFAPWGAGEAGTFPSSELPKMATAMPLVPGDGKQSGTFDKSSSFFSGVTSLYDFGTKPKSLGALQYYPQEAGGCVGDRVASSALSALATDSCGGLVIASGKVGGHRVFAEANMSRFYATTAEQYFNRIVSLLLQ